MQKRHDVQQKSSGYTNIKLPIQEMKGKGSLKIFKGKWRNE